MPAARKAGRGSTGERAVAAAAGGTSAASGVDTTVEPLSRLLPGEPAATEVARGLKGVIVAETEVGDVRGLEGFYHYRQYSAVELAEKRSLEDVWHLLIEGRLPDAGEKRALAGEVSPLPGPPSSGMGLPPAPGGGDPSPPPNPLPTPRSRPTGP